MGKFILSRIFYALVLVNSVVTGVTGANLISRGELNFYIAGAFAIVLGLTGVVSIFVVRPRIKEGEQAIVYKAQRDNKVLQDGKES